MASGRLLDDDLRADIDGFQQKLSFAEHDGTWSVYRASGAFNFREQFADLGDADLAGASGNPRVPMNGVVVQLLAEVGNPVEADDPLLVMEAMKWSTRSALPARGVVRVLLPGRGAGGRRRRAAELLVPTLCTVGRSGKPSWRFTPHANAAASQTRETARRARLVCTERPTRHRCGAQSPPCPRRG